MSRLLLGIDLSETEAVMVLGDESFEVMRKDEFPTLSGEGFTNFLKEMYGNIRNFLGTDMDKIDAVGVSSNGFLNAENGILFDKSCKQWGVIDFKGFLESIFHCPVFMGHGTRAAALAEYLFGSGRSFRNMVFLAFNTAVNAGIIINGKIYKGFEDMSGEIGRIVLDGNDVSNGKSYCMGDYCSSGGIVRLANKMFPKKFPIDVELSEISELTLNKDKEASAVVRESGTYLGKMLSVIFDLISPDRIVLGDLGWKLPPIWLESAFKVVEKETAFGREAVSRIVISDLRDRIRDVAPLLVAMAGIKGETL
jgi:glucokinase